MRRFVLAATVVFAGAASACGGERRAVGEEAVVEADATSADGSAEGLIPNTPPGGLEQWVADIRSGLEVVPAQVASDPALAQKTTLDLYVTRQEYLELYYGENGRYFATAALADAIARDEAAFHRILELVNPAAAGESAEADVRAALDVLDARLDDVLAEARAAGVDLSRPVPTVR